MHFDWMVFMKARGSAFYKSSWLCDAQCSLDLMWEILPQLLVVLGLGFLIFPMPISFAIASGLSHQVPSLSPALPMLLSFRTKHHLPVDISARAGTSYLFHALLSLLCD